MAADPGGLDFVPLLLQEGMARHRAGDLEAAQRAYEQVVELAPANADGLHLLGLVLYQRGQPERGIELIRRAIALNPAAPAYHGNLATLLERTDRPAEAIQALERAASLTVDATLLVRLARLHRQAGNTAAAVHWVRRAAETAPDDPAIQDAAAEALFELRDFAGAEAAGRRLVELQSDSAPGRIKLAAALSAMERFPEALDHLERAIQLDPAAPSPYSLKGVALLSLGEVDAAAGCFEQALARDPDFAPAHYNFGVARLLAGDLAAGWPEYEARGASDLFQRRRGAVRQPVWNGEPVEGKRLLVEAEQGFGDAIQFVRYLPLVAERAEVLLECRPQLASLLARLPGVSRIVSVDEPLPEFDCHVPLLSLPRIFGTTLASVPANVPYLTPDPARVSAWQKRLSQYEGHKVGLTWRGSPNNPHDARRSIPPGLLAPLADVPGVQLFAVRKRETGEPPSEDLPDLPLIDLDPLLADFDDTAAAIACLDLTISVDTSVVHLAGALARPVWVLLPYVPDWRWLLGRADSPWYPTARLFRQPALGAWEAAVAEVASSLRQLTSH